MTLISWDLLSASIKYGNWDYITADGNPKSVVLSETKLQVSEQAALWETHGKALHWKGASQPSVSSQLSHGIDL